MTGAQERPLRADAARNRARVLDVATEVFTTRGVGVPTEEIARAAGVGVGTVFRHFPTKEALLEAVMVRRLEAIAAMTAQLAAQADPAEAFFACFRLVVEQSAGKNEFAQALAAAGVDVHASRTSRPGRSRPGWPACCPRPSRPGWSARSCACRSCSPCWSVPGPCWSSSARTRRPGSGSSRWSSTACGHADRQRRRWWATEHTAAGPGSGRALSGCVPPWLQTERLPWGE